MGNKLGIRFIKAGLCVAAIVAVAWGSSDAGYSTAAGYLDNGGVAGAEQSSVAQSGVLGVVDEVLGLTISRDQVEVEQDSLVEGDDGEFEATADSSSSELERAVSPTPIQADAAPSQDTREATVADAWTISATSVVAGGLGPESQVTGPTTAPPSTATSVPPTAVPPTVTPVPPTATPVPPTAVPQPVTPTAVLPTLTQVEQAVVPPTAVPPTAVPPAVVPPTFTQVAPTRTPAPTNIPSAQRVAEPLVEAAAPQEAAPVAPAESQAGASTSNYIRRGEAALARIPYSLSSIGFSISFHPGRGGVKGLTYHDRNHIDVFIADSMSDGELLNVIAHEIGHAVDLMLTSYDDRAAWYAARGIHPATPWWPVGIVPDFATPAGDFAECFAYWAVGSPSRSAFGSCANTTQLMSQMVRG